MKNWYAINARAGSCEVSIYDEIGAFGVTAKDFANDFASVPAGPVTLRINSPGGSVFHAIAIFNILDRHDGDVTVIVDGIAASAASYIAMVGKSVIMPDNAFMMIHNPSGVAVGESSDMRDLADVLDKITMTLVRGYARKSGKTEEEVTQVMSDETWFSASEALDFGLVDEVTEPVQIAANFDMSGFKNAPTIQISEMSASADANTGDGLMADKDSGDQAREDAEAMAAEIVAAAETEAKAAADKMIADARALIAREQAIEAMDAPKAMKDEFLSEAYAAVPVEAMERLVAAAPKDLAAQVDAEGGAGVEASPTEFAAQKAEASAKVDEAAEAITSKAGVL